MRNLPPRDDLRFSNITGILPKKKKWFIGVEVEQETSAPPPKKNPGFAPAIEAVSATERITFGFLEKSKTRLCFSYSRSGHSVFDSTEPLGSGGVVLAFLKSSAPH